MEAVFIAIFSLDILLVPEAKRLLQGEALFALLHNIQSKNYGVKWYIQLIITLMHRQAYAERQPFLDKFQGKKNIISKEGLLHLLENQAETNLNRRESKRNTQKGTIERLKPIIYNKQNDNTAPRTEPQTQKKSKEQLRIKQPSMHSHNIDIRYGMNQEQKELRSQQLINYTKLPAISKSISVSRHSRQRKTDILNAEITGTTGVSGSNRSKPLSRQVYNNQHQVLNSINKKLELDTYAVRHLEFLDKFQKHLLHNQVISKQTCRSERH